MKRTTSLHALLAALVMASASAATAAAAPGDILSAELERTMTPAEVDAFIAKLYVGFEAPKAVYGVDVYWVCFESRYPDGAAARAYTQAFVPNYGKEKARTRALYAFGPGSTGIIDSCRPSREHVAGIHWGYYRAHVLSHAGQGALGLVPDYLGFNDPDRHQYYMVAEAEAAVMLDAIRAFKALIKDKAVPGVRSTKNFVAGFSQGGHAAFAAADWRAKYAPDVSLAGVIGYGPSTDLVALFKEFPDVAPMVLYTFRGLYGRGDFDPDLALLPAYAKSLDADVTRQCVGGMQSYYPADPNKIFTAGFAKALLGGTLERDYPGIYRALAANATGLGRHRVPVLILQGADDMVVRGPSQEAFVKALRAKGETVTYRVLDGIRHDTRQASFWEVEQWMQEKL